ncbi:MAG: T9SS type A sorting domain-containing protein, partial [Bacteroidota bacterium]
KMIYLFNKKHIVVFTVVFLFFINVTAQLIEPKGVYAVIAIDNYGNYDTNDVNQIIANPAVCGLTIREQWKNIEPSEGNFDFSRIDDAIARATMLNKTIQLIIVPGFYSPDWVLSQIDSCEGYLISPDTLPAPCGKLKMIVPYGVDGGDTLWFPLPWNSLYKQKWQNFLVALAQKYNSNSTVVSIALGGPTSVSCEMTMPEWLSPNRWRDILQLFYPFGDPHRGSNLAFIEEWEYSILLYDQIFTDKTIVVTMANALIYFISNPPEEARDTILEYFKTVPYINNFKGAQTSGLMACHNYPNDIQKVKEMTMYNVKGGAQFAAPATCYPNSMGCDSCAVPVFCTGITADSAVRKVLAVFFDSTSCGNTFGNGNIGTYQLNYLQVYSTDISYANSNSAVQLLFSEANNCLNGCILTSVQEIKNNIPESVLVYPNPFSNKVSIQLPDNNCQLKIFDMLGNIVFKKTLNSKQETLNLNLSDGIYFLQVKSSNFVQTEILEVIK